MPEINLPDGSVRSYSNSVSVADVAQDIGEGLARAALAGIVNKQLVDLSHVISTDAELSIVTAKNDEGIDIIRHSTAHLLANAVKELFPEAQVTIGPVITISHTSGLLLRMICW
jgi:threonyl-tRNA synthetase